MANDDQNRSPRRTEPGGPGMPRPRMAPWLLIALVVGGLLLMNGLLSNANRDQITYTQFRDAAEAGDIVGVVTISDTSITGTYRNEQGQESPFTATLASNFQTQELADELIAQGLDVKMARRARG
jgi:ATP-dependent Zn protease